MVPPPLPLEIWDKICEEIWLEGKVLASQRKGQEGLEASKTLAHVRATSKKLASAAETWLFHQLPMLGLRTHCAQIPECWVDFCERLVTDRLGERVRGLIAVFDNLIPRIPPLPGKEKIAVMKHLLRRLLNLRRLSLVTHGAPALQLSAIASTKLRRLHLRSFSVSGSDLRRIIATNRGLTTCALDGIGRSSGDWTEIFVALREPSWECLWLVRLSYTKGHNFHTQDRALSELLWLGSCSEFLLRSSNWYDHHALRDISQHPKFCLTRYPPKNFVVRGPSTKLCSLEDAQADSSLLGKLLESNE